MQLTTVQTQLFHERLQGLNESVDQFAQELRKLFRKAYSSSRTSRGRPEAEALGQSLLANQFIVGLKPELKKKMVGVEGSVDELLLKSRFEEAKYRELATVTSGGGHLHTGVPKKSGGRVTEEKLETPTKVNEQKGNTSTTG